MKIYIPPRLSTHDSLAKLLEDKGPDINTNTIPGSSSSANIESVIEERQNWFVIANPGYGKSILLKKIQEAIIESGDKCESIELGKITNPKTVLEVYKENCQVYCFDALDEVRSDLYNAVIQRLKLFCETHAKARVIISCRRHDAENNKLSFSQFSAFKFIEINPFRPNDIETYLQQKDVFPDMIEAIKNKALSSERSMQIIKVPRYLEVIVELIKSKILDKENIKTWKRPDFFEQFIYTRLKYADRVKEEGTTFKKNEKEIIKRVLEQLALLMEIYQVNMISKDEFLSFLDGVNSNINQVFLNICDIDTFFQRVLQERTIKGKEYIEFHNTEFQEYLAAKELQRFAANPQAVFDLIVEKRFYNIRTSWYSVLQFLLEMEPSFIVPLTDFLNQRKGKQVEHNYWQLLSAVDPEDLVDEAKEEVFKTVFPYVQNYTSTYMINTRVDVTKFYVPSNYKLIKSKIEIKDIDDVRKSCNQMAVLWSVIQRKELTEEEKSEWINKLMEFVKMKKHPLLQRMSITALAYFGELELLKKIEGTVSKSSFETKESFSEACEIVSPNDHFSVNTCLKLLKEQESYHAAKNVGAVNDKHEISFILEAFLKDTTLLANFIEGERMNASFYNKSVFVENLKKYWDDDIKEKSIKLFELLFFQDIPSKFGTEDFTLRVLEAIQEKEPFYVVDLLDKVKTMEYRFVRLALGIITDENAKAFIKKYLDIFPSNKYYLINLIFNETNNPERRDMLINYSKLYLEKELKEGERKLSTVSEKEWEEEKNERIYKNFQDRLSSELETRDFDFFSFLRGNSNVIINKITIEEKEKIKAYIKPRIERANPELAKVVVIKVSDTHYSRTLNHEVGMLETYLDVANILGFNEEIEFSRKYLIAYLPLIFPRNIQDVSDISIVHLLDKVSAEEEEYLLDMLAKREDDYLYYSPVGFASMVKHFHFKKLTPVLKMLTADGKVQNHARRDIFQLFSDSFYEGEEKYIRSIFEQFIDSKDVYLEDMAQIANEKLISIFKNDKAIKWRFEQLKKQSRKFQIPEDGKESSALRGITEETELSQLFFAKPLMNLQDEKLATQFHSFFRTAKEIFETKEIQFRYIDYMMRIIYGYYYNLKEKAKGFEILNELFRFIDQQEFKGFRQPFSYYRNQLELTYADKFDRPRSIQPCINQYNEVKSKIYAPVYNSKDLLLLIQDVIEHEIKDFIHHEGYYKLIENLAKTDLSRKKSSRRRKVLASVSPNEDYIQKTLSIQLRDALLRRGIRDIDIYREVQLFDNKRIDLIIQYGFIRPVVVEIKLLHNPEITNKGKSAKYKPKLIQYMKSQNAKYGIYLIFKVRKSKVYDTRFDELKKEYQDIEGLHIPDFIDCTLNPLEIES